MNIFEWSSLLFIAPTAVVCSQFASDIDWRRAVDSTTSPEGAVAALKMVHTVEHLRTVQGMSQTGGGFDTDTYWYV